MANMDDTLLSDVEARSAAADGYVFGFPLVLMDVTMRVLLATPNPDGSQPAVNQFTHHRSFPDASFTSVVSPNADTLYSTACLDLSQEPIVLSVPDTQGRYYLLPMLDAWTNVFASPGSRTTGTGANHFAITSPRWRGSLPTGVQELRAPTNLVWIIGRTQTNGKSDYSRVHAIQDGFTLMPLSAWGKPYVPPDPDALDAQIDLSPPPEQVERMDAQSFLGRLAALMVENPPARDDAPMLARLERIGVVPGERCDLQSLGPEIAAAIEQGIADGHDRVRERAGHPITEPTRSVEPGKVAPRLAAFGTDYLYRAGVALVGLGANLPEDAVYPMIHSDEDGQPFTGQHRYTLHFPPGQLPPVNAFWSLTMYNERHYFVDNPLDRYAIGDRDLLQLNPDGSLDILIQHTSPGPDREANWLPAPSGSFNLILRLYWPKQQALDGTWQTPAVRRVS